MPIITSKPSIGTLIVTLGTVFVSVATTATYNEENVASPNTNISIILVPAKDQLPVYSGPKCPMGPDKMEAVRRTVFDLDSMHGKYTVSEMGFTMLIAKMFAVIYDEKFLHLYESYEETRLASDSSVDNELCVVQLAELHQRILKQVEQQYSSKDFNLFRLLDTWGQGTSGFLLGNTFWDGAYNECLRLKIVPTNETAKPIDTRYCVASFKHVDWPQVDKHDIMTLKAGVCLPKACDSLPYKNKYDIIYTMWMTYFSRPIDRDGARITNLYCLPDEQSPLRSLGSSYKVTATLAGFGAWLALLVFATFKHTRQPDPSSESKVFSLSNMQVSGQQQQQRRSSCVDKSGHLSVNATGFRVELYRMLSITRNLSSLFDMSTRESSLLAHSDSVRAPSEHEGTNKNLDPSSGESAAQESPVSQQGGRLVTKSAAIVDLRCIEGVKVISMIYVIAGHVLMCMFVSSNNARDFVRSNSIAFFVSHLLPAFSVNCFFTITGILTCYLIFKQENLPQTLTKQPLKWLALIVYRYMRIMPMYALVVLYTKTLAKYTGSGPYWDYGTSPLSQRKICEHEPWFWTLTFSSNYVSPIEHCIPSAWYLANDFQFFLVTPLFLSLLCRSAKWGKRALYLGSVASFVANFYSLFASELDDLRPIARFEPHGFKTYVSYLSFNYTRPQYRICAYLIGLLIGYELYEYEKSMRRHTSGANLKDQPEGGEKGAHSLLAPTRKQNVAPDIHWISANAQQVSYVPPVVIALLFVVPSIGSRLPFNKLAARIMVGLITPLFHVLFATGVGVYILLSVTGHANKTVNRFLSAAAWKPFSRLSLCVVLINVEVINYIVQSNTKSVFVNDPYQLALHMYSVVCTYVVAILVCVLVEAPLRNLLNALLTRAMVQVQKCNRRAQAAAHKQKCC